MCSGGQPLGFTMSAELGIETCVITSSDAENKTGLIEFMTRRGGMWFSDVSNVLE